MQNFSHLLSLESRYAAGTIFSIELKERLDRKVCSLFVIICSKTFIICKEIFCQYFAKKYQIFHRSPYNLFVGKISQISSKE